MTALSGSNTVCPGYTFVAPTLVSQGQEFGCVGEKIVALGPRQPFALPSPGIPPTPVSPEATKIEVPWRPSLRNLWWRQKSEMERRRMNRLTRCIGVLGSRPGDLVLARRMRS